MSPSLPVVKEHLLYTELENRYMKFENEISVLSAAMHVARILSP